jgi:NADPH-ferrihemoprotein reductase
LAALMSFHVSKPPTTRRAGAALGPAVLFFGCRTSNEFICRDELAAFLEAGAITELHVALSREGAQKDYVQHHIKVRR